MTTTTTTCHARECKEQGMLDWFYCEVHMYALCGDHLIPYDDCGCLS